MNSRYAVAGLLGVVALAVGGCGGTGTDAGGTHSSAQLSSGDRQMIRVRGLHARPRGQRAGPDAHPRPHRVVAEHIW